MNTWHNGLWNECVCLLALKKTRRDQEVSGARAFIPVCPESLLPCFHHSLLCLSRNSHGNSQCESVSMKSRLSWRQREGGKWSNEGSLPSLFPPTCGMASYFHHCLLFILPLPFPHHHSLFLSVCASCVSMAASIMASCFFCYACVYM